MFDRNRSNSVPRLQLCSPRREAALRSPMTAAIQLKGLSTASSLGPRGGKSGAGIRVPNIKRQCLGSWCMRATTHLRTGLLPCAGFTRNDVGSLRV